MMISDIKITDIHISIAEVLLECLKTSRNELITYTDLSNRIGGYPDKRNLDPYLEELSLICQRNGMPYISSIVINYDTKIPGNGYFKVFFSHIKNKEDQFIEWSMYIKEVFNYSNWTSLNKILHIPE